LLVKRGGYALMWSGGKDSALALYRARKAGIEVSRLLTFYDRATRRVRFHATRSSVVSAQAKATGAGQWDGIGSSWPEMEAQLVVELGELRDSGVEGVVFGDIHLADVRAWYEDRVRAAGLEHVEPIWGEQPADLLREFVDIGGRAVVTCVDLTRLDASWLGRIVDERFVHDITDTGVDVCGENGEFHTFAFEGPMFVHPVGWRPGETRTDSRFSQLDVLRAHHRR
jgi:diphthine-ammonia ligase